MMIQQQNDASLADSQLSDFGAATRSFEDHKCQLFFAKCDIECSEEEIKAYFEPYGEILKMKLIKDNNTKKFKGFGFLTFPTMDCVNEIQKNRPHSIRDREIDTRRVFGPEQSKKPEISSRVDKIYFGGIKDTDLTKQMLLDYFTEVYGAPNALSYTGPRTDANNNHKNGFSFVTYEDTDVCDKIVLDNPHTINTIQYTMRKGLKKEEMSHYMNNPGNSYGRSMYQAANLSNQPHPHHTMGLPYSQPQGRVMPVMSVNSPYEQMNYNQMMMGVQQPQLASNVFQYPQFQQQYQQYGKIGTSAALPSGYYQMAALKAGTPTPASGYIIPAINTSQIKQQLPATATAGTQYAVQSATSVPRHPVSATLAAGNATQTSTPQIKNFKVGQVLPQMPMNTFYQ